MSEDGYKVTKWAGKDNYVCDSCPFATLNEFEIKKHVAQKHRPPPKPQGVILLDKHMEDASSSPPEEIKKEPKSKPRSKPKPKAEEPPA